MRKNAENGQSLDGMQEVSGSIPLGSTIHSAVAGGGGKIPASPRPLRTEQKGGTALLGVSWRSIVALSQHAFC